VSELLFQCPVPDCEKGFDAKFKLDQHMDDTGHCECETPEEDWDDEVPSPEVRQVPLGRRQRGRWVWQARLWHIPTNVIMSANKL